MAEFEGGSDGVPGGADDEVPGHIAADFYLWLWFASEVGRGQIDVPDESPFTWWVDDRLSFRPAGEDKVNAVLTGDNPSTTPEARAALAGGKVLRDVRLALRRDDREYAVTLRGPGIAIAGAKLPALVKTGDPAEIIYERMFLYEELHWMVGAMFRRFAEERTGDGWSRMADRMRAWASGRPEELPE